jgi:hypothetical protein
MHRTTHGNSHQNNLQFHPSRIKIGLAKLSYGILQVTFASVRFPNFSNASLRLSSVVDQDRFPMKQRYSSASAISYKNKAPRERCKRVGS